MSQVSIVILNYNGSDYLKKFLPSVLNHSKNFEVIVADNGSTDDSINLLKTSFPDVRTILFDKNHGFTGGYNLALKQVQSEYYVLLNSDVEVSEFWINPMLKLLEDNREIAAVQPKILSYSSRDEFEYAGAGGGFIDRLGYPFCRGRIFSSLEKDHGQYDDTIEVFWASGACLFIRAEDYWDQGGLDEDFFAHMEEIDLCWRMKNQGKKVYYCGASKVYHVGGGTLSKSSPRKTYYNFRNGLEMLLKNTPTSTFFHVLPTRMFLDLIAMLKFTFSDGPMNGLAIIRAYASFLVRINGTIKKRYQFSPRAKMKGLYPRSIVLERYLRKKTKYTDLGY